MVEPMDDRRFERSLKALANGRRLSILRLLKKRKELSVTDIAEKIRLSFRSTSRHLAILSAAEIVEREQRSLQVFYRIRDSLARVVNSVLSLL